MVEPGVKLTLPVDLLPEAWLLKYDSNPRILPRLPESDRMALVVVITDITNDTEQSEVYWVRDRNDIQALLERVPPTSPDGVLCFRVPKKPLTPFL